MAEALYCSKSKNKVHLEFSFIGKCSKQVLLGFHSIENTKIRYDSGFNLSNDKIRFGGALYC